MKIKTAKPSDLNELQRVYQTARKYMKATGNPTQWGDTYPSLETIKDDIMKEQCYVLAGEDGKVHGAFVFFTGPEPTYSYITDGQWLNSAPYGTIHRVASDGEMKGVFTQIVLFCRDKCPNLRIDTHHNNLPMQHVISKNGFTRCGIIYAADGSPRIAYQLPAI